MSEICSNLGHVEAKKGAKFGTNVQVGGKWAKNCVRWSKIGLGEPG